MKLAWVVVTGLLATAAIAQAAPAPTVLTIEIDRDKIDKVTFRGLPQATAEPGGIEIPKDADGAWKQLGLEPGDVVRSVNGAPLGDRMHLFEGRYLLEVDRKGAVVYIALAIHRTGRRDVTLTDDDFKMVVERARESTGGERLSTPVASRGKPSGVRVIDMLITLRLPVEVGDLVRTFNGNVIRSDDDFVAALTGMRPGLNEVVVERAGRPLILAITRQAPVDLSRIRKLSDTSFAIPRSVRDAVKDDMWMLQRRVAPVPWTSGATVHGWKLLQIERGSLLDAIGLRDEDIVLDVDGRAIDTTMEAIQVASDLEAADTLTVHVQRRGKPLAIVYKIVP
ncbi:MAG: hypothetical protein KF773_04090 [Deltaproteobacteria bacterium]|nr:hypothetical protein [Deltaproteobacteria bacterium]